MTAWNHKITWRNYYISRTVSASSSVPKRKWPFKTLFKEPLEPSETTIKPVACTAVVKKKGAHFELSVQTLFLASFDSGQRAVVKNRLHLPHARMIISRETAPSEPSPAHQHTLMKDTTPTAAHWLTLTTSTSRAICARILSVDMSERAAGVPSQGQSALVSRDITRRVGSALAVVAQVRLMCLRLFFPRMPSAVHTHTHMRKIQRGVRLYLQGTPLR